MDDRERGILRKARVVLVKNLSDISGLCDRLLSYGVLTENMVSEVMDEYSSNGRVRKLLDIIPRRGKDAYSFLHQALIETGQQEMADLLKPEFAGRPKDLELEEREIPGASNIVLEVPHLHHQSHSPPFDPETHKPLDIKLQKCNKLEILATQGDESIYKLETKPKGKVLIINITKFEDHGIPSRDEQAHNISATSITALFKKLNFKVETKSNITAQDLLYSVSMEQNSEQTYDCFVMIILTHGSGDLIFMSDGHPLRVQNILEEFNAEKCPKLKGKPKLFFIHACPSDHGRHTDVNIISLFPEPTHPDHHLTKADMFLARAVRYDPIISNQESKGFRFIQVFVHIMKNRAHLDDLLNIVTNMNSLAEDDEQLVETTQTLTKKLYFFPE